MEWWHDMRLNHKDCRLFCSRPRWGRGSAAPSGRSYRGTASAPSGRGYSGGRGYKTRDGVALIVVLGFLSIMLMMAVAFLTQARIERLVAGASMEGMRTRQMAQTAMAAAMQDYLNALKEVPQSDPRHNIFLSGELPVTMGFYYSGERLGDDRLLIGKVEDWLLDWHLEEALGGGGADDHVRNAEWIWVRETPGQRSRILGRYAYACFDMSGLVDANLLGSAFGDDVPDYGAFTNRNNVRKMLFEAVSLSPGTGGERQFKLNRHQRNWRGFDSPAALLNLTDGIRNVGSDKKEDQDRWWKSLDIKEDEIGGLDVSRLSSYSYSVLHKEDGSGKQKVQCTSANIQAQPEFSRILAGASLTDVARALDDYESTGVVPSGTDYPSVKNVPMFNEIGFQVELEVETVIDPDTGASSADYTLILRMKPEFWYPFPSEDNQRSEVFTMTTPSIGCGGGTSGAGDIWVRVALGQPGSLGDTRVQAGAGVSVTPSGGLEVEANPGNPYFARNANDGNIEFRVPLESTSGEPLAPGMNLFIRSARLNNALKLQYSGGDVDATAGGFGVDLPGELADGAETEWVSMAVTDPRLNHDDDAWIDEEPHSLGTMNRAATDARASVTGMAPGNYFYCRNGPIEYPGELGYLSNGRPWETLDIFSDDGIQLMNRLICDQDMYDIVNGKGVFFTNGTINPYTRYPEVLNAAFYGLDMREVPGMAGDPDDDERLSAGDIENLVEAMMEDPLKNGRAGWARVLNSTAAIPDEINKNNRIAILNNTWGLFNESDRLFVVAVVAQSIKESDEPSGKGNWDPDEDMITGERRAVALGWLDGSADVGGQTLAQEMNIVAFQYLNE